MKFTYLGHSAGYLETASERFLFDPFLTGNPKAAISAETIDPSYILLTHGHQDHVGDSVAISNDPAEFRKLAEGTGAQIRVLQPGESIEF